MVVLFTLCLALALILGWAFRALVRDQRIRRDILRKLRDREEKFRTIADNATDIIWTMDLQERFTYASPSIERVLGYTVEEGLTLSMQKVLTPESYALIHNIFRAGLVQGRDRNTPSKPTVVELEHLCKDGSRKWCEVSNRLLWSKEGRPEGVIGVTRDISERKAAEEKLYQYQMRLRSLSSELSLAEERERRKIAGELHDRIGQALAAAKIKLGSLRASLAGEGPTEGLDQVMEMINQTIRDTRSLTFEISPPILYELGLEPAVEWLLEQIQQQHGLRCNLRVELQPPPLDDDLKALIFRMVREALLNVTKHARARSVDLSFSREDGLLSIRIVDDGVGFDRSEIRPEDHRTVGFGLFNLRERLQYLGGRFHISSTPGKGTAVVLQIPVGDWKAET